jgi:pimeloyl-ACP methyl ester carboxylesterase
MTRAYREITYTAPLSHPLELDAYLAPDPGDWRVVVFPGTPCNKLLYTRFLRTAPRGLEVVVITRPGFGKGYDGVITDFSEQAAAIKPFLPGGVFAGKKLITLGVSYGGELALKAALDFPQAVKGVVTVAALIDEPHDYALTLEKLGGEARLEPYLPNRWHKVRAEVAGRRAQIGPLLQAIGGLDKPVEVLHGDFDALVPRSNAYKLMEALGPDANLDIITGGTHYLELQYPRRLHRAIERVIARAEG